MLNLQETSQISEMVDFIGNRVEFFGQKLPLENGVGEFSYVMRASQSHLNIANSNGINVFFADADTNQGKHTINWDGVGKMVINYPTANTRISQWKGCARKLSPG